MPYAHPVPAGVSTTGQHALNVLYQHRLVSTGQLHRLITPQNTTPEYLRRQLQSLRSDGLAECVNRRRHGQTELLWWLTEGGAEAVEATGLLSKRPYRMSRQAAAGPLQEHTLATVETGAAFVTHAVRLGHECGPLDWTPEIAHYYRAEDRPGEELSLVPDAVLHYVHTEADRRTLLTFFIEVDRAQMTVGRLAQKLHAYAAYHAYAPQPATRAARATTAKPQLAWRSRYPLYPRVLLVLTGATSARLQSRINDLRSLAAADPRLPTAGIRAGITTLDELRDRGPFAPIVTPVLGPATPTDIWLAPTTAPAATAA